jgi:hypothetical protein
MTESGRGMPLFHQQGILLFGKGFLMRAVEQVGPLDS